MIRYGKDIVDCRFIWHRLYIEPQSVGSGFDVSMATDQNVADTKADMANTDISGDIFRSGWLTIWECRCWNKA